MNKPSQEQETDVLVLGAGPAGCAVALALRQAGCARVVLVDRALQWPFHIGESATPDVPALLRHLGVTIEGHLLYHGTLSLWGGQERFDDFLRRGQGPGWHLDRALFDLQLRETVLEAGGEIVNGALCHVVRQETLWHVGLGTGGTFRTPIVVDATGRRAAFATRIGARKHKHDGLVGLAVRVENAKGLAGQTMVESFDQGWWYAAPRHDGGAIVTLMTDHDLAAAGRFRDHAVFAALWAQTKRLQTFVELPEDVEIVTFPAQSGWLDQAAGPGWVAVGDALLGLDPLTSSGISNALRDGIAAAQLVMSWRSGADARDVARLYADRANHAWQHYLEERHERYGWEKRWPDSPFWARRQLVAKIQAVVQLA